MNAIHQKTFTVCLCFVFPSEDDLASDSSPMYSYQPRMEIAHARIDVDHSDSSPTPSSANSDTAGRELPPPKDAADFLGRGVDAVSDRGSERSVCSRSGTLLRNDFIRLSIERNRACQEILRKQMSESLWCPCRLSLQLFGVLVLFCLRQFVDPMVLDCLWIDLTAHEDL